MRIQVTKMIRIRNWLSLKIVPLPRSWARRTSWPCCTPGCRRPNPPLLETSSGKPSASSPAWAAAPVKTPRRTEASQRHTLQSQIRAIGFFCQVYIQCCVSESGGSVISCLLDSDPYYLWKLQYFIIFNAICTINLTTYFFSGHTNVQVGSGSKINLHLHPESGYIIQD